ncbi:TPA: hypothetical protein SFI03_001286 [Staphylococcus aureus]|uniref:hypothetical protein n=2 Tax=Staphylococcus aureus TaxID=1280 RepID=UPI001CFA50C3|nr:hypothetical protein [Staphylococcus aureus]MDT1989362.1 hypothetical protein [Staphylococcus aureus]HEG7242788.1 hypothetical protein [Staphylococcus aureus]
MTEIKCTCNKHFSILVRGANTEADEKSAYDNVQVGGAPTQRISKRNSTGNASWGVGPNIEKLEHQFLQTMQVGEGPNIENFKKRNSTGNAGWRGPNTENFEKRNSTGNAGWRGPNIENFEKEILQAMQVGDDKEIFFLYHTVSHSLSKILK